MCGVSATIFAALFHCCSGYDLPVQRDVQGVPNVFYCILSDGLIEIRVQFLYDLQRRDGACGDAEGGRTFAWLRTQRRCGDELMAILYTVEKIEAAVFSSAE